MRLLLLCLKIFFARILDVSLGVIRTMELVKNNTMKAVIIAFFEVLIWFLVAREALSSEDFNLLIAIFYALGYSCGTLIGSYLSKILIKGNSSVLVISSLINNRDIKNIKKEGYGLSSITLDNSNKMLFIQVENSMLDNLLKLLNNIDNKSFISIIDTKNKINGFF
jgi:uncharacterized protein YebE (UPF0316 family)